MNKSRVTAVSSTMPADADLRRRVVSFLHVRQVPGVMAVHIDVQYGTVILRGALPSPQAKRLCLECCRRVAGVTGLQDEASISGT